MHEMTPRDDPSQETLLVLDSVIRHVSIPKFLPHFGADPFIICYLTSNIPSFDETLQYLCFAFFVRHHLPLYLKLLYMQVFIEARHADTTKCQKLQVLMVLTSYFLHPWILMH